MSTNKEAQNLRDVKESVQSVRKDVDRRLDDLKGQMNVLSQKATKTVVERPLLTLAVTFVTGMAIGIALARSSD